ncbi:unnamed protein product [Caenorhabditis brenneri]
MRKPKFIRRILDRFVNFKLDLPKTTPPKRKFPILQLPFVAQKHVLWMLELRDLIPLSFLSKRSKRMIKQALPTKIAQYDCTVCSNEVLTVKITSRFGSYSGSEPNIGHIIEVLSYPPIQVFVYAGSAITKAAEWMETHHHCVKKVSFSVPPRNRGMSSEFINPFTELNAQSELVICSKEEILIENPDISLMQIIWGLECRRLRLISERSSIIFLANFILFDWIFGENYESSTIEQLIFELRESGEIEWKPENPGEKREDEWKHPIYGKINVWYRLRGFKETKEAILFKVNHDGKQLLVLNIQRVFGTIDR